MAYTGDFAIVAEGFTDQLVLTAILEGFYADCDEGPFVVHEQPPSDTTAEAGGYAAGGWSLVVSYFRDRKYLQALEFNRYLVVHIDTDVAEDYGVSRQAAGQPLDAEALVQAAIAKLCGMIPAEMRDDIRPRLLFAIGVDEIECWLLPLVFDKSNKKKRAKTTGCLEEIDHELRKRSEAPLSRREGKNPDAYRALSKPLTKRKVLDEACRLNAGFRHFIEQLEGLGFVPEGLGRPASADLFAAPKRPAKARRYARPPRS